RELNLPANLPVAAAGQFSTEGEAARNAFVRKIVHGLQPTLIEKTTNRDIMQLSLSLADPTHAVEILDGVLRKYEDIMRKQTLTFMLSAEEFYVERIARCGAELSDVDRQLADFRKKYPGIHSSDEDPTVFERKDLQLERTRHQDHIDDLRFRRTNLARKIARSKKTGERNPPAPADASEFDGVEMTTNPKYAALRTEIGKIDHQITDNRKLKFMTDLHPTIVSLRKLRQRRSEELANTVPRIPADSLPAASLAFVVRSQEELLIAQREKLDAGIASSRVKLANAEQRIEGSRRLRNDILENREAYWRQEKKAGQIRSELQAWQGELGPLRNAVTLEKNDRGIHFAVTQKPYLASKPSAPVSLTIMLACLGIGLAFGAVFGLLKEFVDRSFRTAKQLSTTLGVPVIESVDEIITRAIYRKRMFRQIVLVPALMLLLTASTIVAGTMAYFSIENPSRYEQIKTMPQRAVQLVIGQS
ncbi:MAG: hypothetical protein O7D94_09510, partial [Planctomycetota bacterium]|nr:hypothetical protein [Planctomycetota bacterium]